MISYRFYDFKLNCYELIHLIKNITGVSNLDDDVIKSIKSLKLREHDRAKLTHSIAEQLFIKIQDDNGISKIQLKNDDFDYKYEVHIKSPSNKDENIVLNSLISDIFTNHKEILRDLKRYFDKIKKQSDELDKIINSLSISV